MSNDKFQNEVLTALGRLTIAFAGFEGGVSHLVSALLHQDNTTGDIITNRQSISSVLTMLEGLFMHLVPDNDTISTFYLWLKKARICVNLRNTLVHSIWDIDDLAFPARAKGKVKKGVGFQLKWEFINLNEIKRAAELADETHQDVFRLIVAMEHKGIISYLGIPFPGETKT